MIYTLFSAFCIAVFVLGVLYVGFEVIFRKRDERIAFFRRFKKGQFAYIYVAAIPIYFMGYVYSGMDFGRAAFNAISQFIGVIALSFDFSDIDLLMANDSVYATAVYMCFTLVVINAMILTFSVFHQLIWTARKKMRWVSADADKYLIIGNNKRSLEIYSSEETKYDYTEEERKNPDLRKEKKALIKKRPLIALSDDFSEEDKKSLFIMGYTYIPENESRKVLEHVRKYVYRDTMLDKPELKSYYSKELERFLSEAVKKNSKGANGGQKRRYTVIINTENEERNIELCRQLVNFVKRYLESVDLSENEKEAKRQKKKAIIGLFSNLSVHVFGDARYEAVYSEIVDAAKGCLHYEDKYRQIAIDFVDKHPLTQYMGAEHIDTEESVIKPGVNVNVCIVGFGRTGQQLFLTSVANNQFMEKVGDSYALKMVKYHIFDKEHSENNKNLNHNYYRYRNEFFSKDTVEKLKVDPVINYPYSIDLFNSDIVKDGEGNKRYLELPQLPAEEYYHELDINDTKFYNQIREIVTSGANDANFIIVAFGSDLENLDFAKKLVEKKQEWGTKGLRIFVKVRSGDSSSEIFSRKENDCFLIGDEKQIVYNIDNITNGKLLRMALRRHKVYSLEYDLTHGYASASSKEQMDNSLENAEYNWYVQRSELERNSNLYAVLSLRSKLHLMGMDYVNTDAAPADKELAQEDYMNKYAGNDRPNEQYDVKAEGKTIYKYPLNFKNSRRTLMAMQEHYRWNSYMLSYGIVPATKEEIATSEKHGKDYKLRRHGNLTTFDGLLEYRELAADFDMRAYEKAYNPATDGKKKTREDFVYEADVIKYDYQILDDAIWFLEENGYKIIERS